MTLARLNDPNVGKRLAAVRELGESVKQGVTLTDEVNNHVHTIYSFSPYTPTCAAVKAAQAGLQAVGIMDHDSVSGCAEMLEACKAIGIASTAGFEMRVDMTGTAVEGRKTNNPDTLNNSYMAAHGIPATQFQAAREFLRPMNAARILRDREQVARLNAILAGLGIKPLDFDRDVAGISQAASGGSITERHILCALSLRLIETFGRGAALIRFVQEKLDTPIPPKLEKVLLDDANPHYVYDLLGLFKSSLVPRFFVQPDRRECISIHDAVRFVNGIGAIPAYAYLGDVGESPTGDKKAEKFEDDYLDQLVPELKRIGFKAITYMPPRNTLEQLLRLQRLCAANELMEISGVDINSSRQEFNCPIIMTPPFRHLTEATWALIAHEKLATANPDYSLFSPRNPLAGLPLNERIRRYARVGAGIDSRKPDLAIELTPMLTSDSI
ncbi:MAG: PHP domain-containing protein [bacterium]